MNIFKIEKKVADWINNNRIKWCFCLLFLGILIGYGSNHLMGGNSEQGLFMSIVYGFLLVIVEIFAGGI